MIRLIVVLVILMGAVWLAGYSLHDDANYVVVGWGEWVVKSSLSVFLVLLLMAFVPTYLLVRGALAIWRSPRTVRAWRSGRRHRDAQEALTDGLTALAEGRWRTAENQLVHSIKQGASPVLGYIAAAHAAQSLGSQTRRDNWLRLASDNKPTSNVAVGLTQAEMQLGEQQREHALATLLQLRSEAPHNTHVLELLHRLYLELGDWDALLELMLSLRTSVLTKTQADALELRCLGGLLVRAAGEGEPALKSRWESIPRNKRQEVELLGVYTELVLHSSAGEACELWLRAAINRKWDERLVYLYGLVQGADANSQLSEAERWLTANEQDATLLLTVGRLCVFNRLWGKARSYLDASIGISPEVETHRALSELLDELGEHEEAARYARQALSLTEFRSGFLTLEQRARLRSSSTESGGVTASTSAAPTREPLASDPESLEQSPAA